LEAGKNVSTVAIKALLDEAKIKQGFSLKIRKNIAPGSGLGSSASSSAAAVFAADQMLGTNFSKHKLIEFAMKGEELASGKPHADNVAPSILGGFTIIRSYEPLDIFNIPYPEELRVLIIHPELEVKTSVAKSILRHQITMQQAISQWGNASGLVAGLIIKDFELIQRSLEDVVVEPVRSMLIPYYQEVKNLCLDQGAIGFNISGSGPSMFAFVKDDSLSDKLKKQVADFYSKNDLKVDIYQSKINPIGAKIL
jgi:homoserine kinase